MTQLGKLQPTEPLPLFVTQFKQNVEFVISEQEPETAVVNGEILLAGDINEEGQLVLKDIRRISFASEPLNEIGIVSFSGSADGESIESGVNGYIENFGMWLYYNDLGISKCTNFDSTYANLTKSTWEIGWEPGDLTDDYIPTLQLSFHLNADDEALIQQIDIDTEMLAFTPLDPWQGGPIFKPHNSISPCSVSVPVGMTYDIRRLGIRFILLTGDPNITVAVAEGIAQELVTGACEVWLAKGGIAPDPHPNLIQSSLPSQYVCLDGSGLYCVLSSTQEDSLPVDAGVSDLSTHMNIFLVDRLSSDKGGGVAKYCMAPTAFIVLEIEQARHNRFLLAHELGHVLGLRHPGEMTDLCPATHPTEPGSHCAVMVPSKPNSNRITNIDLMQVDSISPPLGPEMYGALMISTDRDLDSMANFAHIVRDFPYDDGKQDSVPGPVAAYWWTHSDIWNSNQLPDTINPNLYADNDLIINPDHSPNHREPYYTTTATQKNYMYIRLHTCQDVAENANINVYIYLVPPGVTSEKLKEVGSYNALGTYQSAMPLSFVGANHPSPTSPKIRHVEWDVYQGYPVHSCVFAVITSNIDSPATIDTIINSPGTHTFFHLHNRLRSDNDVAQRNLHIQGILPLSGITTLPPMLFENILPEEADAKLIVDLTAAENINSITLIVNNGVEQNIEVGQQEPITLHEKLPHGEKLEFQLQVNIDKEYPTGTTFPINLLFLLGDVVVNGYEFRIHVTTLEKVTIQALDTLSGALRDVAIALDLDSAFELAMQVKESDFQTSKEKLNNLVQLMSLNLQQESTHEKVAEMLSALVDIFDVDGVQQIRDIAYRIQHTVGYIARNK